MACFAFATWAEYEAWHVAYLATNGEIREPFTFEEMAAAGYTINQYRASRNRPPIENGDRLLSDLVKE